MAIDYRYFFVVNYLCEEILARQESPLYLMSDIPFSDTELQHIAEAIGVSGVIGVIDQRATKAIVRLERETSQFTFYSLTDIINHVFSASLREESLSSYGSDSTRQTSDWLNNLMEYFELVENSVSRSGYDLASYANMRHLLRFERLKNGRNAIPDCFEPQLKAFWAVVEAALTIYSYSDGETLKTPPRNLSENASLCF